MTTVSQVTDTWVVTRFRNQHEDLGKFGEKLWSRLFLGCGLFYIPLKDLPAINGKGPRLQGNDTILPDFEVSGQRRAYVDSKCKSTPVLFRIANEMRQGINKNAYDSYSTISEINLQKCLLGIVEIFQVDGYEWSGSLLVQSLGLLGKPIRGFSNQSHMVYWPRDWFKEVGVIGPEELWRLASGESQVNEVVRGNILGMFKQKEPPMQRRFF